MEQTYVQSKLGGITTWVTLPKDRWPESFKGYRHPVLILRLSLYGHPDAGGYWEAHCKSKLEEGGFQAVDDWTSVYWHPNLRLLLMVYVDDFKMSGPAKNMIRGWNLIRKSIQTDEPQQVNKCLGCEHTMFETTIIEVRRSGRWSITWSLSWSPAWMPT